MKKKSIVTTQMKYDYSQKVVFKLYMNNLVTLIEYKTILHHLMEHYGIVGPVEESNVIMKE